MSDTNSSDELIVELKKQNAELQEKLTAHEATITNLKTTLESQKSELDTAEKMIDDLNSENQKLAVVAASNSTYPTVTSGGKQYQFTVPQFRHEHKLITVAEAAEDQKLIDELVEMQAGVIKAVE